MAGVVSVRHPEEWQDVDTVLAERHQGETVTMDVCSLAGGLFEGELPARDPTRLRRASRQPSVNSLTLLAHR